MRKQLIVSDPNVMMGKPVIAGILWEGAIHMRGSQV